MRRKIVKWDEHYIFRLAPDLLLFSYLLYSPFDSILEVYPVACVDDSGLSLDMLQNWPFITQVYVAKSRSYWCSWILL